MARDYIIDGYNLLLRWRRGGLKPGPGNLERAREALIAWIARHADDPSRITIVFDASRTPRIGLADSQVMGIRVVFSEGYASADDWIIKECQSRLRHRQLAIVSSDREIQLAARRAKAEVISADSFIADLHKRTDFDEEDEEDEIRSAMTPRSSGDSSDKGPEAVGKTLSSEELDAFREVMKQTKIAKEEEEIPSSKAKPAPPSEEPPGIKKEIREDDGMEDFYRHMRDWKGE